MTSLREIQRRAYRAFLDGETSVVTPDLAGNKIPRTIQVQIYQNNVRETFRKTLASSYPVIEQLVGDACFRGLCQSYLRRYRSSSGSLQHFGAKFFELLADQFGGTQYGYLPDVAHLEWACEEVLADRECNSLYLQTLGEVSPAEYASLRFQFLEGIRLIGSDYPILAIWRANQPGESATVDLSKGSEYVAIMRRDGDAVLRLISPLLYQIIQSLQTGMTLGEACGSELSSTDQSELVTALGSLMNLGVSIGQCPSKSR
jgi:hypothetical protein